MRLPNSEAVHRLVNQRMPETQTLDFKRELSLRGTPKRRSTQKERRELLKDLSGMGNGGGGTVVFGIDEDEGIAEAVTPLTDVGLVGVLHDVVRDGIRPPLLYEYASYDCETGYVLIVDVEPSALGPYQVYAYDDPSYYRRQGDHVWPMSEHEVRDAYTLAARAAEHRPQLWRDRALPLKLNVGAPTLSVSGLPREPMSDILDLRSLGLGALRPPDDIRNYLSAGLLVSVLDSLRLFADGYTAQYTTGNTNAGAAARVHRDGSAGLVQLSDTTIEVDVVLRTLNGQLAYLGWLWDTFGLRRPLELRLRLDGLQQCSLAKHGATTASTELVVAAGGLLVQHAELAQEVLPWRLAGAPYRHRLLDVFADRLVQAFGSPRHDEQFRWGWLFGHDGQPTGFGLHGGFIMDARVRVAAIDDDGWVINNVSERVGCLDEGVVLDVDGNTLALVEFAPGIGCPAGFFATSFSHPGLSPVPYIEPQPAAEKRERPSPSGSWSSQTLAQAVAPR